MCWMALIPLAISVVGGMSQGRQQEAAANSQASQLRTNAMFANEAAGDAMERGRKDAGLQRLRTQQMIGTQRAVAAANGGDVNDGSNALLQEDTAALGELDALTIQNNAAREAYGYKVQAIQGFSNARQTVANGQAASRSSFLGGVMNGVGGMMGGGGMGGGGSAIGTFGAGTMSAMSGSSRLNNNQGYA